MATRIAYADGNLTGATTWKTSEAGASAEAMIRSANINLPTNTALSSPAFTITNADVIEGVLLWVAASAATPAGTLLVELQKSAVTQASVTVNCADLPHINVGSSDVLANVPVFFKFTATATGDGTANWTIKLTTSAAAGATINYWRNSGTAGDFTRALRTSTTVSAAAGDDLYVVGELTGAGTHNNRTVTMDSTATTAYGNAVVNTTAANGGGVRISNYGTLVYGTSASTNYVLRVAGDVEVFWNGTLTIGANGSEIPRSSTAVLELVMTSATNDFGLTAHNMSTVNMYGLSRTSGKNIVKCKLNADAAAAGTSLTVDTDTGWLSGDAICVASGTRTTGDAETVSLTGNATATTMAVGALTNAHKGTAPTQCEVGLLTRNVKFRSTSNTLWTYVYMEPLAAVTFSWTEFRYMGANTANKYGISMSDAAVQTAKTITNCSIYDTYTALRSQDSAKASFNLSFTFNVIWNISNQAMVVTTATGAPSDWVIDNCLIVKAVAQGIWAYNFSGTITNTSVSSCSNAFYYTNAGLGISPEIMGTFSGNTAHSNSGHALYWPSGGFPSGSIANYTAWRNGGNGININGAQTSELTIDNVTLFGNTTRNLLLGTQGQQDTLVINGGTIAGDASFSTANGITFFEGSGVIGVVNFVLNGVDMSGSGTGLAAHTSADIDFASMTYIMIFGSCNGCNFGATNVISAKTAWGKFSYIGFEKYKNTAGDHRFEAKYGQIKTDTTIFNNASPSMRLTPTSATVKLESAPNYGTQSHRGVLVAVANGNSANVSAFARKSVVGDGAAYNGNQPRMICRRNDALGLTADTVLATYSAAAGTWAQISGTTPVATDDGVFEIIFDCDGTAGWVNVDDVVAS